MMEKHLKKIFPVDVLDIPNQYVIQLSLKAQLLRQLLFHRGKQNFNISPFNIPNLLPVGIMIILLPGQTTKLLTE